MDNSGRERKMNAREMTEEINRATEVDAAEAASGMDLRQQTVDKADWQQGANVAQRENLGSATTAGGVTREKAQQFGWQVMAGGRDETMQTPETDWVRSERELREVEREVTQPENFVGQETALQSEAYLAEDTEDLQSELGEGLKFIDRIVAHNQEEVAKKVAPEVEKIVNQKSFAPSEVVSIYNHGTNRMLKVFNRTIGERNNAA